MKFLIYIILLAISASVLATSVEFNLVNRIPPGVTQSDIANIANNAVTDIKNYYLKSNSTNCVPSKEVKIEESLVGLIKSKAVKKLKVSVYENSGIIFIASFNETEPEVVLNVDLINGRCNKFFFYASKIWSDPV